MSDVARASFESECMRQALALAALADGATRPNPRVGCLLVRDGEVVGRGFHRAVGGLHAEAEAIANAGAAARGATLFVNLEPCAHHGRTPPCVEGLIEAGVARVVASMQDPDPRVDGRGFERLRAAGIAVSVGLLRNEAMRLNEPFLHWQRCRRPLVTLKAALTRDGMLRAARDSRWITGAPARLFAHRLRAWHDAVLVGADTVRSDDPSLDARIAGVDCQPLRVVLATELRGLGEARMFREQASPVRVYLPHGAVARIPAWSPTVDVVGVTAQPQGLDLGEVLDDLGAAGIRSVMVEGGSRLFASFLEGGFVHHVAVFTAPTLVGAGGALAMVGGPAVERPAAGWRLVDEMTARVGVDRFDWYRLAGRAGEE